MQQENNETKRPTSYSDAIENYLYMLRESSLTNMLGASPYLMRDFSLSQEEAYACLGFWMVSFSETRAQTHKKRRS
jgi:hypothetical protein